MKQQYKVLSPFELKGFRAVAEGELISMNTEDAIAHNLMDYLELVETKKKK